MQADVLGAGISYLVVGSGSDQAAWPAGAGDGSRYGSGGPSPQARGVGQGLTPRTQKRSKVRAAKGVEVTEEGGQKA